MLTCSISTRLFLIVAGSILLLSSPLMAGQEEMRDGVLHIRNGSEPSDGLKTLDFEESWRVGGEDSEEFFGMISKVVVGPEGTIYLLDTRLSEVPVYSPTGERLNTLSRQGEGPGEVNTPSNLLFMPDGTLGIVQVFPGKITKIQLDGTPAGVIKVGNGDPTTGGFLQIYDCMRSGDDLVISGEAISQDQTSQTRTNFLAVFDQEGIEKVRLLETPRVLDFTNAKFDETVNFAVDFRKFAVGPDGRIYAATARDEYVVKVFNPDGTVDRIIQRDYESLPRTDEEYNRIKSTMEAQVRAPFPIEFIVSRTEPDISTVEIGPDGLVWVRTSRGVIDQPDGILMTCDVFDLDGHFVRQVSARCDGDGEDDYLIFTPSGDAVLVTGYTEAIQALQGRTGTADEDDDEESEPMEVIFLASRQN